MLIDRLFGSPIALAEKGTDYLFGLNGCELNLNMAYEYFSLASKKGNKNAKDTLELFFAPGKAELSQDMKDGFDVLRKLRLAVEDGDPSSCFLYGVGKLSDDADDYMYSNAKVVSLGILLPFNSSQP